MALGHSAGAGWDTAHYPANDAEPTPALPALRSSLSATAAEPRRELGSG